MRTVSLVSFLREADLPGLLPYLSTLNALLVLAVPPRLTRRFVDLRLTSLVVVVVAHALRHPPTQHRIPTTRCTSSSVKA
jgi:hypothetical protein